MKKNILLILISISLSCSNQNKNKSNEWINLFDGTSLDGWRAYNGDQMPPGWKIIDSVLTFKTEQILEQDYNYKGNRDIMYGEEEFENFELYLEWKIPKGGNSGIYYHIKEGYGGFTDMAPEYQLLDDENYAEIHDYELKDWQLTAADYAMHVPDTTQKVLYPPGQWNSSRIIFTSNNVEHWLNDKKVLSFIPWTEQWYEKRNSGKWDNFPDYGKYKKGYIGLQDHGSNLWFRNIKIKKL
ncbi:MAG: DUF1080 domain-containing protein [Flavobacteriaceae bacterium]|nr:DUF1080 domain-containing protein [Flavobacteriaceae bacterium]MDG1686782.1 DUF1080 domain-containing protein [Flavobacteriaceae bacterium]